MSSGRTDRFFCDWPECGRSYSKPSKLAEHYRSHTNDRCFGCEWEGCGKSFLRKGHLQRHYQTSHLKERPFVCAFEGCDAAFALKHHLSRHEKLHANPKPFVCEWPGCQEAFSKHDQLKTHVACKHTGETIYKCTKCCEEFKSKQELKRHDKSKHASRTYMCGLDGCGEIFTKWSAVVAHRKSNHLKPTLELYCEECGRGPFKTESSYRQHCKIHAKISTNVGQHGCPHCENKTFSSRSSLKAHLLAVHSSELPFACAVCEKSYGYKKLLKRHMERTHGVSEKSEKTEENLIVEADNLNNFSVEKSLFFFKERSLLCPIQGCNRHFFRPYDLSRHMQSLHQ